MKTWYGVAVTVVLVLGNLASDAMAQDKWPAKSIRMIVPFPTGAASDVLGRIVAIRLAEIYGQQIVVDNRPGAGGLIGSDLTRQAAPDGYTVAMIGQPHLSAVLLVNPKPYDPIRDFAAIGLTGVSPNVIVLGKGIEAKTIPDLIALAKANPGKLNYGSAGIGSSSHLAAALFLSKAKIEAVNVPFRQAGESRTALINGTIQFYVYPLPAIMTMVRSGTIRALAVTMPTRAKALPDVPTSAEAGFPQYQSSSWFGLIGPRALPGPLVARINADMMRVQAEPAIREKFELQGADPGSGSPEDFTKMMRDEYAEFAALIKEVGMKAP